MKPSKPWGELRSSGGVSILYTTTGTRRFTLKQHEHVLMCKLYWTPVYVNKYVYELVARTNGNDNEQNIVLLGNRIGQH